MKVPTMGVMITVVQRVLQATITVENPPYKASITKGLCVFLGIHEDDDSSHATWIANKLANLRIFRDSDGKMNDSVQDIAGEILLISQFTLIGECTSGHRPSYIKAARPEKAAPLVAEVGKLLEDQHGISIKQGVFGAMMQVQIVNDGPVTLVIQRD